MEKEEENVEEEEELEEGANLGGPTTSERSTGENDVESMGSSDL